MEEKQGGIKMIYANFTDRQLAECVSIYMTSVSKACGRVSLYDFAGLTTIMLDVDDDEAKKLGWTYEDISKAMKLVRTKEGYQVRMPDHHCIEPLTNWDRLLADVYFA